MRYVAARTQGRGPDAPFIFTFHGTGGDEHQFHGFASQLNPNAHVISPRGDVMEGKMARYFKRTGEGVYDMDDLNKRTKAMAAFLSNEVAKDRASRVQGIGYSNGANILASVALSFPETIDDLILMHPLIPWKPDSQPGLKGRRILITAGRQDPICPAEQTQNFADYLASQGAIVTLHWHNGGHEIAPCELVTIQNFIAA